MVTARGVKTLDSGDEFTPSLPLFAWLPLNRREHTIAILIHLRLLRPR